ncbi:MAG: RNA-binding domain-containing protein, partial [Candidatus Odinarchaeota archaeon]
MSNEQDYIEYKKQDKTIKLQHKANFYAFHTDFLNVSGITMDINPPYLFGTLPNSEINFGVLGTGFYVSKEYFNHPSVESFESNLISYKSTEQLKKSSEIKELLGTKESEFLDFKSEMYKIHDENAIRRDLERVELLRDMLSLINIKRTDKMIKDSYLIIGIEEENEQFNGNHRNIDFRDNQTIYNLIKDYINPSLTIEINDYFINGNLNNFKISLNSNPDYNRNIIIRLVREIGVVYEIKKNIGRKCPKSKFGKKVTFLNTGDSFTRDGSFPRRLTEVDRI